MFTNSNLRKGLIATGDRDESESLPSSAEEDYEKQKPKKKSSKKKKRTKEEEEEEKLERQLAPVFFKKNAKDGPYEPSTLQLVSLRSSMGVLERKRLFKTTSDMIAILKPRTYVCNNSIGTTCAAHQIQTSYLPDSDDEDAEADDYEVTCRMCKCAYDKETGQYYPNGMRKRRPCKYYCRHVYRVISLGGIIPSTYYFLLDKKGRIFTFVLTATLYNAEVIVESMKSSDVVSASNIGQNVIYLLEKLPSLFVFACIFTILAAIEWGLNQLIPEKQMNRRARFSNIAEELKDTVRNVFTHANEYDSSSEDPDNAVLNLMKPIPREESWKIFFRRIFCFNSS